MEDTYSYKGWLISDSLLKRAFAVWGHYVIAQLMVAAIIFGVILILGLFIGGLSFLGGGFK